MLVIIAKDTPAAELARLTASLEAKGLRVTTVTAEDATLLKNERVTPRCSTHIQRSSFSQIKCCAFNLGHLLECAEKCFQGYLILLKHRREHPEPDSGSRFVVFSDGSSHRVVLSVHITFCLSKMTAIRVSDRWTNAGSR